MATTDGAAVQFAVDGEGFGGSATFSMDRLALLVCTADADEVARLLPSPLLHPVRWFNGRAVIVVAAGDQVFRIGQVPPIRSAEVEVDAMVTYGRSRAAPVLPLAGQFVPLVGGAVDRRYRVGLCAIADVITNRVAAEILRLNFGPDPQVCAIREDRGRDRLRLTAADAANGHILSIDVPVGGRSTPVEAPSSDYFVTGPHLQRSTGHQSGSQSVRLGRSTARLHLGQHRLAERLRGIGLSTRPLMTIVQRDVTVTLDRPPERLAPAQASPAEPTPAGPVVTSMVIAHEDGREEEVDQLPDGLPFDPAGVFEPLRTA